MYGEEREKEGGGGGGGGGEGKRERYMCVLYCVWPSISSCDLAFICVHCQCEVLTR